MNLAVVIILISIAWSIYKRVNMANKKAEKRKVAASTLPSGTTDWNKLGGQLMNKFNSQAFDWDESVPAMEFEAESVHEPVFDQEMKPTSGSLNYDSPEGTEFHGDQHLARPAYEYEPEPQPAYAASERPQLTQMDMRRAVVMAEILGKPVSMRRR